MDLMDIAIAKAISGGGGGASSFYIEFSDDGQGNLTSNKTYEEVEAAYNNNMVIIGKYTLSGSLFPLGYAYPGGFDFVLNEISADVGSGTLNFYLMTITLDQYNNARMTEGGYSVLLSE